LLTICVAAENEIIALPETWEDEDEAANSPEQALQYAAKVQQLKELNERRASLRRKVADMKLLKEKLAPFENPKENVQQNLVTKNGEVERELEKMRMLLARVKGRLETLPATSGDGVEDIEVDVDMDAKVLDLLQNGF
jgi:beta-glucosidase-like glycosyl hydrolase